MLIQRAQHRQAPKVYTEKHHIIPRSLGGSDNSSNIVVLTAREHFIAHCLLARIHGGNQWSALMIMCKRAKMTGRQFEKSKIEHATSKKGSKWSIEQRQAWSIKCKGKPKSKEHAAKVGMSHKGLKHTDEAKEKMKNNSRWLGKYFSNELKKKVSDGVKAAAVRRQQLKEQRGS